MAEATKSLAAEIERLHKAASPAPWAPQPGVERERVRGRFWSRCKGFPPKPVGQMDGQETSAEREANMQLACLLRSHVPEILAALHGRAFEDGARKGLSETLAAYGAAVRERETAEAVCAEIFGRGLSETAGIGETMDRIGAEGACIRASMAERLALTKLVDAVRAALPLQPEGERSDA